MQCVFKYHRKKNRGCKLYANPFTIEKLTKVIELLGIKPIKLVRTNEQIWKDAYKGKDLSDLDIVKAMVENPKLIQRPIVINGSKAVVARPLELVNTII